MKRPWQVWLLYGVSMAVAFGALAWLTASALVLEQAEVATRDRSVREERVRLALWRMDTWLMPLVAQESARPYSVYTAADEDPFAEPVGAPQSSVLFLPPSSYVLVNFQIADDGTWASLQHHEGIERSGRRLAELRTSIDYQDLVAQLPRETLPPLAVNPAQTASAPHAAKKPNADFTKRQSINTSNFASQFAQQRAAQAPQVAVPRSPSVSEGLTRPVWSGEHLLLARRVTIDDRTLVQGCWLDWPKLAQDLRGEIADLIDPAELQPIRDPSASDDARSLATLPVQLVVPSATVGPLGLTPLRTSLAIAWVGSALAAAAIGASLAGVIGLSQRRAAFVSAVTHELRTPLTTFRMYSEMLDENMIADEAVKKDYLHTLRVESDRLAHLVENVLAYARLERGRHAAARERVTLHALWNLVHAHLSDRAKRSGMELVQQSNDGDGQLALWTDPAAVEQILFNLVDNAAKYASRSADRTIDVQLSADERNVRICVRDHGPGIAPDRVRYLFHPFSKSAQQAANSAPGVGLGLALCRRLARQLGGDLRYEPPNGVGAAFVVILPRE